LLTKIFFVDANIRSKALALHSSRPDRVREQETQGPRA
jgi:hypothetical protein